MWDYIDGVSSTEEKTVIGQLVQENNEWRSKYAELLEVHQLMQSTELEEPSMRFTRNVMDELTRLHIAPATKSYINQRIIKGLAVFFISMIVGFLVYGFGQVDWTSSGDSIIPKSISNLDYGKFFNNTYVNIFMMVNLVLGLFLLDRFLANKRKKFTEEA